MPPTCKTPADEAGASRDLLGGWSRNTPTPLAMQAQWLASVHHVRPELAAMLASLAFGGHGHG